MAILEVRRAHGAVKHDAGDLALLGGEPIFAAPRSTANLVQPDFQRFLGYSQTFYNEHRFSNAGPLSKELEQRLAAFHGAEHCVTFANGFWALVLAIRATAMPGRTEVIMPSLTYRRLADIVGWTGLVPHFCDVDRDTLALNVATAAPCLNDATALLLAVHPIVNCCPADELELLAEAHGIPLVIDAVESCYETLGGRKVGSFGRAEVFSLGATKLINGFEGGYLTTNDGELAERVFLMRGFGFKGHDNIEHFGVNAKLNEIHAAMALASLDDLDAQVLRNQERYATYRTVLADVPGVRLLNFDEAERCGYKNIVIELLDDWPLSRGQTLAALHAERILARPYYSPALHHSQTPYRTVGGSLPVTDECEQRFLLLPSGAQVSCADIVLFGELLGLLSEWAETVREVTER